MKSKMSEDILDELDMSRFGHLSSVNKKISSKPGKTEFIFDTGVEFFIPNALVSSLNLRFTLEQRDVFR